VTVPNQYGRNLHSGNSNVGRKGLFEMAVTFRGGGGEAKQIAYKPTFKPFETNLLTPYTLILNTLGPREFKIRTYFLTLYFFDINM
jgi:hypothetical protein